MDCAVDIIVDSVRAVDGNGKQCECGTAHGISFGCQWDGRIASWISWWFKLWSSMDVEINVMVGCRCGYHGGSFVARPQTRCAEESRRQALTEITASLFIRYLTRMHYNGKVAFCISMRIAQEKYQEEVCHVRRQALHARSRKHRQHVVGCRLLNTNCRASP